MAAAAKIAALMEQLTAADVQNMPPAERERFAFLCARFCSIARTRPEPERTAGVLMDLRGGRQG
jgi:hypothetical protein